MKERNKLIIISTFVAILLIGMVLLIRENEKNKLENKLTDLGKDFYENYYYDLITREHGINQIAKYSDVGIKTNLETLKNYDEEKTKIFIKKGCNKEKTKVIIYPNEPYNKKNYKIEINLSC